MNELDKSRRARVTVRFLNGENATCGSTVEEKKLNEQRDIHNYVTLDRFPWKISRSLKNNFFNLLAFLLPNGTCYLDVRLVAPKRV